MLNHRYNFFLVFRTVIFTFWYAGWKKAYKKRGIWGVMVEFLRSLTGLNTWPFFIDSKSNWKKHNTRNLLQSYGIKIWGWGYSQGEFMFRVKKEQAYFAQYIMLQNGIHITGRLLNGLSSGIEIEGMERERIQQKNSQGISRSRNINWSFDELSKQTNRLADKIFHAVDNF